MLRADDELIDPRIAAELDAIDATLAGEPVDPRHAEIAELALLLAAGRPEVSPELAASMDARVARRFAPEPRSASAAGGGRMRWWRAWQLQLAGAATAMAAIAVGFVALAGTNQAANTSSTTGIQAFSGAASTSSTASATSTTAASAASRAPASRALGALKQGSGTATTPSSSAGSAFAVPLTASAPAPLPNSRKIIQSAQLALSAPPSHIDDVSQELFQVVARANGFVQNSQITASQNGYAQFQLSVPSSALQATMSALSALRFASVVSRTDTTQDINSQYLSDVRKLADARALRTSLLKQLASASTQQQIDSLTAQLHDAEASIHSDEATLGGLNHQVDYSQISVTINAAAPVPLPAHHSGAFGIGKAAHDAGRVLTVAAGVALIALAALVPVALIAALAWWITSTTRRRRREHALDMA